MKIWEKFKEEVIYKYVTCNIFHIKGSLPETEEQKYWYNKALQDSFSEMKLYEKICEAKYDSLVRALAKCCIAVCYNPTTCIHTLHFNKDIVDILIKEYNNGNIESIKNTMDR